MRFVVAVAVVVVQEGRVLALRRAAHRDAGAGLWEVVSGRVESGEEIVEAALREVREETGLDVEIDPRPVDSYPAMRGTDPMVVIVYAARRAGGELVRSSEHDDSAWLTAAEFRARTTLDRLADSVDRAVSAIELTADD